MTMVMFHGNPSLEVAMCQSYRRTCVCGERESELFFGKNILNEGAVREVYCPACASTLLQNETDTVDPSALVQDNGWVLSLDMEVVRSMAQHMALDPATVTADEVFRGDYVTWVGFSPEDSVLRAREQQELAERYGTDRKAHFLALRKWAMQREQRLAAEGWTKARRSRG